MDLRNLRNYARMVSEIYENDRYQKGAAVEHTIDESIKKIGFVSFVQTVSAMVRERVKNEDGRISQEVGEFFDKIPTPNVDYLSHSIHPANLNQIAELLMRRPKVEELQFDFNRFEDLMPYTMRFKDTSLINGNELYWVTMNFFERMDLRKVQDALNEFPCIDRAYVTFRGISSLNLQQDRDSEVLITVTRKDIQDEKYIEALAAAGYSLEEYNTFEISSLSSVENLVFKEYMHGDSIEAYYNGKQIGAYASASKDLKEIVYYSGDEYKGSQWLSVKGTGKGDDFTEDVFRRRMEQYAFDNLGGEIWDFTPNNDEETPEPPPRITFNKAGDTIELYDKSAEIGAIYFGLNMYAKDGKVAVQFPAEKEEEYIQTLMGHGYKEITVQNVPAIEKIKTDIEELKGENTMQNEELVKPEIKFNDPEKALDWITVEGGEMSNREKMEYLAYIKEKYPERDIKALHLAIVNENGTDKVDISCEYTTKQFERIRRITGYLVGDQNRFNDAKKAEVRDRVKHEIPQQEFEDVYVDSGEEEVPEM